MTSTMVDDPRLLVDRPGLRGVAAQYRRRIASGDIGPLPVVIGLAVIWAVLAYASQGDFLRPANLVSSVKFMITGAVLLTAVTIDAIARRGREASGR